MKPAWRPLCMTAVLVLLASARALPAAPSATQPAAAAVIQGRVVDGHGLGVPDVNVSAVAPAMGQVLGWAQSATLRTRTAPDGNFALPVPAAGVLYELNCERPGYGYSPVSVIAGGGGPAR